MVTIISSKYEENNKVDKNVQYGYISSHDRKIVKMKKGQNIAGFPIG